MEIGIMRIFGKKQTSVFYSGQKASHKKNTALSTFVHDFFIIFSLITQRVFIGETFFWVRWKCKIEQNSKNKKTKNNNFFLKFWFR
jgi:hypothetical protein